MTRLVVLLLAVWCTGCLATETEVITPADSRQLAGSRLMTIEDSGSQPTKTVYSWNASRAGYVDAEGTAVIRFARLKGDIYLAQMLSLMRPDFDSTGQSRRVPTEQRVHVITLVRLAPPRIVPVRPECGERTQVESVVRSYGLELRGRGDLAVAGSREGVLGFLTAMIGCHPEQIPGIEITAIAVAPGGPELADLGSAPSATHRIQDLERRCSEGDQDVCFTLAQTLRRGLDVPAEPARAATLLERLCTSGRAEPCTDLGVMLDRGEGVPRDPARATALLKQACADGEMYACDLLKTRR